MRHELVALHGEAPVLDSSFLGDCFGTDGMREAVGPQAVLQSWLDSERALAEAEAGVGIIPAWAAERIAAEADAATYDLEQLRTEVNDSQHPLVPVVRALTKRSGEAGRFVHWGATTQDILDTGLALQARSAIELLHSDLDRAIREAGRLAKEHANSPMAGRTHGQHAVPISFGLKAATWHDELTRADARLLEQSARQCVQLGGAAGTLAALGEAAEETRRVFARQLGLREPTVPWHTSRDRVRDLGHALSQVAAAGERVAAEVVRLQATEVAEVSEPTWPGRVGSSTMPQKQNPMMCEYLVASARLVYSTIGALSPSAAHAGERDMGLWAVEWLAIPQAFVLTSSVTWKLSVVLSGLAVDPERMRTNLELTRGGLMAEAVMMALAPSVGHEEAHRIVGKATASASAQDAELADVLIATDAVTAHLGSEQIRALLDPTTYLGSAPSIARNQARTPSQDAIWGRPAR